MPEKLTPFLDFVIRTSPWKNTPYREHGYDHGIPFGQELGVGGVRRGVWEGVGSYHITVTA